MKVIFDGKEHEAELVADLYVLDNGHVASRKDCKPVKDKAQDQKAEKAEPKPNKAKKKKAE